MSLTCLKLLIEMTQVYSFSLVFFFLRERVRAREREREIKPKYFQHFLVGSNPFFQYIYIIIYEMIIYIIHAYMLYNYSI